MNYIKNLLLSLKEVFIMMILQYIILIITIVIFGINTSIILGSILISIIEIIFIIYKFKGCKRTLKNTNYFPYFLLGISVCSIYNMFIFKLGIQNEVNTDINILLNIICSGIIGPIFEETLFRYSLCNNLIKFNSDKKTIFISSLIFSLCHTNIITIIYAFIIGLINSYLYVKKKDITIPIVIHITINIFVNIFYSYNKYTLILGFILLLISLLIIKRKKYTLK